MQHDLPILTNLPVYRETYCDQKTTDAVLGALWEQRPDLIAPMVAVEAEPDVKTARHYDYRRVAGKIIEYVRKAPEFSAMAPPSRLGMLDLIYELTRRIRYSLKLPPLPIEGRDFAPSDQGPFPNIDSYIIDTNSYTNSYYTKIGKDKISFVLAEVYRISPGAFYELAEQYRRNITSYEITYNFTDLVGAVSGEESGNLPGDVLREAIHIIYRVCEIGRNNFNKEFKHD